MSTPRKSDLEQILEHLVNEDTDKAESLLHEYIVAKSRSIYESVVNEEDSDCDDMDDDVENDQEEVKEDIGGDEKEDFIADIEANGDDIDSDEVNNGEVDNDEYEAGEEASDEDRIEDLESQLEQLRTEFETLMNQEMEEPYHDESEFTGDYSDAGEGDMGMDMEMDMDPDRIQEATKLQDEVSVSMDKEGQFVGTGKNSKGGKPNTHSTYSDAARKESSGPGPVDFTKGKTDMSGSAESAKDHTPSDNIGEEPSNVNGTFDEDESGFVGTGKNSKRGKVNTQSPLSKKPTE